MFHVHAAHLNFGVNERKLAKRLDVAVKMEPSSKPSSFLLHVISYEKNAGTYWIVLAIDPYLKRIHWFPGNIYEFRRQILRLPHPSGLAPIGSPRSLPKVQEPLGTFCKCCYFAYGVFYYWLRIFFSFFFLQCSLAALLRRIHDFGIRSTTIRVRFFLHLHCRCRTNCRVRSELSPLLSPVLTCPNSVPGTGGPDYHPSLSLRPEIRPQLAPPVTSASLGREVVAVQW